MAGASSTAKLRIEMLLRNSAQESTPLATKNSIPINCVPNCAQGTTNYFKLVVTLSQVKYHNGRAYFSVMGWHLPGYVLRANYPALTGRWVSTRYFRYSRSFWR